MSDLNSQQYAVAYIRVLKWLQRVHCSHATRSHMLDLLIATLKRDNAYTQDSPYADNFRGIVIMLEAISTATEGQEASHGIIKQDIGLIAEWLYELAQQSENADKRPQSIDMIPF